MKAVLAPKHFISAQSMGASFNTPAFDVTQADNIAIQLNYDTGSSPVGSFQAQVSLDQANWVALPLSIGGAAAASTIPIPGSTSPILIDLFGNSYPYLRIVYTRTSGTATVDGYITYKRLGD